MRFPRPMKILAGAIVLCALLTPLAAVASLDTDLETMTDLERAARQKSLALLAVLKNMGPEFEEGIETVSMARIISVSCDVREARGVDSRVILNPNLNDEFEVIDQDDSLIRLDLGDGRTGWLDESHLQRFELEKAQDTLNFYGMDPQQLRRFALVTDELLEGIDEDREIADEIVASYTTETGETNADVAGDQKLRSMLGAHAKIVEFQAYARHFHDKYILSYDFSLKNQREFLENLSAWGEVLLGKSSFTTKTMINPPTKDSDKVDGTLRQISLGGDLEINERSAVTASVTNKKEVNQTAYSTNSVAAGYSLNMDETTHLGLNADTYAFADDVNTFNDFRRTTFKAAATKDEEDRKYGASYTRTSQGFEENKIDDFLSNGLDLSTQWKRGRTGTMKGKVLAVFESSDVAFHNFNHITPSLEYSKRTPGGSVRWRGLYEMLDYKDAALRSFGRTQVTYQKSSADGPRRNSSRYSVSHKNFSDNPLASYLQAKAAWSRNQQGPENIRRSLSAYTNYFPDNTDNNYADIRAGRSSTTGNIFQEVNVYSRLWYKPWVKKPYIVDVFGQYGWVHGNIRIGPTVGMHLMAARGSKFIKRDGNLFRLGGKVEGSFSYSPGIRLILNASYDYGFVYSDEFEINTTNGAITTLDVVQRHPTTLQVSAFGSKSLGKNFDLTSRLTVYKIATDMDSKISINPVTNNDRFTLFVGLRYRHN